MNMTKRTKRVTTVTGMFASAIAFFILCSVVSGFQGARNTIKVIVNGSDDFMTCPSTGDCSLTAAFHAVMRRKEFKSFTNINIAAGNYKMNQNFAFIGIDSLNITALSDNRNGPILQCQGVSSGLSFYECRNIVIQGLSLVSCGALYNSSSYNKPQFYSAMFLQRNKDFQLRNVAIRESLGIGLTIYDTTGNVTIANSVFGNNGPKSNNICKRYESGLKNGIEKHIAKAGGGLNIEFTYSDTESNMTNSYYHILQSKFTGNIAPFPNLVNATFKRPGGIKHVGFGRGGGLSLYLRGSAHKNTFCIDSCEFQNNLAVWGGGYFIQFLDNVQDNKITIVNTNVTGNNACLGGGAFEMSAISNINESKEFVPNSLQSTLCLFSNNSAVSGGGGTIFGRTSVGYKDNSYYFNNCTWERNRASVGSAITLKLWDYDQGLFGPNSPFIVKLKDCNIVQNTMISASSQDSTGLGAVYDFLVPLFLTNVNFTGNTNTSLVLDTSSVTIMGCVVFSKNTGFKGGAVAMYGEASFNLTKGSMLIFEGNVAKEKGGAIFVESPGPDTVPAVANNYLQTHECFFKYEDRDINPNDWQTEVIFSENVAPHATGYSVFANSLQDCVYPGDRNMSTVLQWKSFHYYAGNSSNSTLKRGFEITTDAVRIQTKESDWNVPPDTIFSPQITLLDEKNNSVYGMVHIGINTPEKLPVTLGTPSSLFLVKDNIPFLDLKGCSGTNFSVAIRTVGGQLAQANVENLQLRKCNPGFVQKGKKCVCLSVEGYSGISHCNENGTHVYLKKGYWAGEVESENGEIEFVTAQCPTGYCNCIRPNDLSLRKDECVYDSSQTCRGNRIGVLCGSCKSGYDVQLGVQECSGHCDNSDLWRLAPLLICLSLFVFFIFMVNLDIFTCYMNAWLYFYQVVNLIIGVREEVSLDHFLEFVIGLANITIDGFGSCMWKGMDNLLKLGFSYLLPVYVFIVILVIGLIARTFPNSYFARNSTFRASCTLFVLCYSTLTRVSMDILRPSKIGDTIVVFNQGTVKYFSTYHSYFAVPAILILLFLVIPFPFILMFTPFFIKHVKWVNYATPLFNTFQACFKNGYRWFAAFYFFSRFLFLLFATFIPYGEVKVLFMQFSCVVVLTIHVYLCPYLPEYDWINKLDSLLLTVLMTISIIAGQMTKSISKTARDNMVIIIDVLAYIPLIYAVIFAFYLLYKWVKTRFSPSQLQEQGFQNFSNVEDTNYSAAVNVI